MRILFLLSLCLLSSCVTGFDGEKYLEHRKIMDKQNAQTEQLRKEEFRRKQEAYYDMQLRKAR